MKSKLVLTSIGILLASAVSANATPIKPFVGLTLGIQGINYSASANDAADDLDLDLPQDFFNFGAEAGARFGEYKDIYNYGFMLNVDKSTYSDIKAKFSEDTKYKIDTITYSATFDNYIRISGDKESRIDLVLGIGGGAVGYHMDSVHDETRYSAAFALKAGMDFELTKNVTLSATGRFFKPMRAHYHADYTYIFGGAVKYVF